MTSGVECAQLCTLTDADAWSCCIAAEVRSGRYNPNPMDRVQRHSEKTDKKFLFLLRGTALGSCGCASANSEKAAGRARFAMVSKTKGSHQCSVGEAAESEEVLFVETGSGQRT